jgi:hypothetical protein
MHIDLTIYTVFVPYTQKRNENRLKIKGLVMKIFHHLRPEPDTAIEVLRLLKS